MNIKGFKEKYRTSTIDKKIIYISIAILSSSFLLLFLIKILFFLFIIGIGLGLVGLILNKKRNG